MEGSDRYRSLWNERMEESKTESKKCSKLVKVFGILCILIGIFGIILDMMVFSSKSFDNIGQGLMDITEFMKDNIYVYSNFEAEISGGTLMITFSKKGAYLYAFFVILLQVVLIIIGIMLVNSGNLGDKILAEK